MLTREYRAFVVELLAGMGAVEVRRMFNFEALFFEGTIFGVVMDQRVFLKTDENTRGGFEREGSGPFTYESTDGTPIVTSYYELPARLFDESDEAVAWARLAYEIALRSPTTRRRQRKRVKPKTPRQPSRRRRRA